MILEDYIRTHAQEQPQKTAVVCGEEQCSYESLLSRIRQRAEQLSGRGCRKGQVVCLRATASIDYLVTYFALHTIGAVAAPLEQTLSDAAFAEIARKLEACDATEGTADVLYTTGTTGEPKGVMISHRTILADAENLIEGQGFTRELAFVVNGPLNHIGSLSKVYPVVMLGATLIIVDGLRDINKFFAAFEYPARKMATFLVPASIRILLQFSAGQLRAYAHKIDFIETGAAAISQADMLALCRLLPESRLYNTYASTETGIISTYDFNDGRCIAGCLGRPMSRSRIVVTDKGLICCQGDTLMSGYIGDPERTAAVMSGGTIYTSDLGFIDGEGMLHLAGREDDVINVGGFKVAPTEVEDAAMSFSGLKDCICIAADHPITGKALKLIVVMSGGGKLDKRALALHLRERLEAHKVPMLYEQADTIRRTFNGKLDRKAYRETGKGAHKVK